MAERICSLPDCPAPVKARGICNKHYPRWRADNPQEVAKRVNDGTCSVGDCASAAKTRGMCGNHYNKWLASRRQCSIDRCDRSVFARGWCSAHYMRWKRGGTPYRPTVEQRFFASVEATDSGCWEWAGTREERGYGNFYFDDRTVKAHRWAFEFLISNIPDGLEVDHLCLNKSCVNPWHLEVVPGIENQRRRHGVYGSDLRRCIHGHAMTADNVYVNPSGVRCCRTCMNERRRHSRKKRGVTPGKE